MTVRAEIEFPVWSGPMTVQDLEGMPDDGRRHELVDGVLIVSPVPGLRHQKIVYRLYGVLDDACPTEFDVVGGRFAVHSGDKIELNFKKAVYERLGVQSYWAIEPEEPALTVFELDEDGTYQQVAKAAGDEVFDAERPFPVRIVPRELLGRLA